MILCFWLFFWNRFSLVSLAFRPFTVKRKPFIRTQLLMKQWISRFLRDANASAVLDLISPCSCRLQALPTPRLVVLCKGIPHGLALDVKVRKFLSPTLSPSVHVFACRRSVGSNPLKRSELIEKLAANICCVPSPTTERKKVFWVKSSWGG